MNAPLIATQLVEALGKVSPGLRATSSASSVHKGQIVVLIDADDALRVIDFINDNTQTVTTVDPRQGQLFDPAGY
jgi:hypothetical protein